MSKVVDAFRRPSVFIETPVQASCRVKDDEKHFNGH